MLSAPMSVPRRMWRGRGPLTVALIAAGAVVAALFVGPFSSIGHAAAKATTVSLTFDDSDADQMAAEQTMVAAGLHGTFYTVSGWLNAPDYLTLANLQQIAADGNEIAGHTVMHQDLPTLTEAEQQREICDDRYNLVQLGFQPTDFAYPFADSDTTETLAKACGYNSARGLGDVISPNGDGDPGVYAETTPPPDPYYLRAPDEVDDTWTLAQMEAEVTNAETHSGGWVILTFHHICTDFGASDCEADQSTSPTIYDGFITWLAAQQKAGKVSVKTVQQVIGGTYTPPVYDPPPAAAAPGVNALTDPWLNSTNAGTGFPTCMQPGGWGTNTVAWATSTNVPPGAPAGSLSENLTVTNYSSGDAKLLPTMDLGACTPTVVPGDTYNLSVQYESTGTTQFALYYRTTNGAWYYWTSSPWFATASTWTTATFTTPAVPAGANGVSFGLALITNGSLTTNDYSFESPAAGATARAAARVAPAAQGVKVTVAAPKSGKWRVHVHSHRRLLIPGKGKIGARQHFAVPPSIGIALNPKVRSKGDGCG
jgi:peptidoglycan/xylan/chitin deacetylase (PgdA/CDA1 family)